ncbi:hypothetical protein SAMN05444149_101673 [Pseudosulfitobacter pseudonitzschiae]|uniref:Uncharacterized protein n=1 Tax=Pseudosulfitobacter pseudonitzschiae TaxID=1402135 RepID=A0A073J760_9RHOB|nr:hypothetical protein [Pseudosulfitobacter pseudonitzschiae]KEJ97640.1 hypothetical protein SUH3_01250 [Pseudosulfitobacter pseudonitzschiae]SHE63764.1 hypothetical protein SAMN05444149_101673 [Pseudosulfitobacter pseudonitzschiae]
MTRSAALTFNAITRLQLLAGLTLLALLSFAVPARADISKFVGSYKGSADVLSADGTVQPRDMSVEIGASDKGFTVRWTSTRTRDDGTEKSKSYAIRFIPSDRNGIYAAAMGRNVFGHDVQLDPMQGEPYVWARLSGDTLSVYSLFVTDEGGYEIQQYDRTLVDEGLRLKFQRLRNGAPLRSVSTVLKRQ